MDPGDRTRRKVIPAGTPFTDLLVPIFRSGKLVYEIPPLEASRTLAGGQIQRLHPGIRRFLNPHQYPVGLEPRLHDLRTRLILEARDKLGGEGEAVL